MSTTSETITVLLADDHFMVRVGLAASIGREPDLDVIGEADSCEEACRLGAELKPDVAVIDMHLGDGDGSAVIESLRESSPTTRCLVFSVSTSENDILHAHAAGASGYLAKSSERDEFIDAIRCLARGETYFPTAIRRALEAGQSRPSLSPRESDVLKLLTKGLRNKEIADALKLSELTVKQHISAVFRKLEVADRTQAAIAAVERGLISLD